MNSFSQQGQQLLAVMGAYATHGDVSIEQLRTQFAFFRTGITGIDDFEAELLLEELIRRHGVTVTPGAMISVDFDPWYDDERRRTTEWFYWRRYKQLISGKLAFDAVREIDRSTDEMIAKFVDPKGVGIEDRRGMGLGDVQAGKTSNYTGLVCKAADLGYRVIIIVAGIHENLRSQTQDRIDLGFAGWRSAGPINGSQVYGVGTFDARHRPTTFTTTKRDFQKRFANQIGLPLKNLKQPVVFVVKKNPKMLENLIEWLKTDNLKKGEEYIDEPMLLIDDEADNASINIAKPGAVSKINGHLRELLQLFRRRTYCAYTATPFANIFIEPTTDHKTFGRDLFPNDFLTTLYRPSNYFGAAKVFGGEITNPVKIVKDRDPHFPEKPPKVWRVEGLPESLLDAVRAFLVVKAIRLHRGQIGEHNSMLVNVSQTTAVQNQVRMRLDQVVEELRSAIEMHSYLGEEEANRNPEIAAIRDVYEREFHEAGVSWPDVLGLLSKAIDGCVVKAENSASRDRIDYGAEKSGLTVIGVGGYSLGRGLTLEGLSISYLLRNTKTYDTLMQMARWFGYRPGYEDLCKIWMTAGSQGWYTYISEATEELRRELVRMQNRGETPEKFGLKVRAHPAALEITARNKQGSSRQVSVSIDLVARMLETSVVHAHPAQAAQDNQTAAIDLARACRQQQIQTIGPSTGRLYTDVPLAIVREFLGKWNNHKDSNLTQIKPILAHVNRRADEDTMREWDVAFIGTGTGKGPQWSGFGFDISQQIREMKHLENGVAKASQRRFSSRGIARIGMRSEQIAEAEKRFLLENPDSSNVPDGFFAEYRDRPLLAIHAISPRDRPDFDAPILAWTIIFPSSQIKGETVDYLANTTWTLEYDDLDEDEYADDSI